MVHRLFVLWRAGGRFYILQGGRTKKSSSAPGSGLSPFSRQGAGVNVLLVVVVCSGSSSASSGGSSRQDLAYRT